MLNTNGAGIPKKEGTRLRELMCWGDTVKTTPTSHSCAEHAECGDNGAVIWDRFVLLRFGVKNGDEEWQWWGWSLKNVTVKRRGSSNQKENPEDEPLTTRNGNSCDLGCSLGGQSQTFGGCSQGWMATSISWKWEGGRENGNRSPANQQRWKSLLC